MAIQIKKNAPVSLTETGNRLQKIIAGLGWDPATVNNHPVDLDLSVFMMGENGKLVTDEFLVFYNNHSSPDHSTHYPGDSRGGEGDGDDEIIEIDLAKIDPRVEFLYFAVTIDQSEQRGHHFGHVGQAYIKIGNAESGETLCEYRLNDLFTQEDSLIIASIARNGGAWDVEAIGQAFTGGLGTLVDMYQ